MRADREILWVDDLDDASIAVAGSKMARLGGLRRAGVAVPGGFVVSTSAYARFLHGSGLDEVISRRLRGLPADAEPAVWEEASAEIRRDVEVSPIPPDLGATVASAYDQLVCQSREANLPVAVRSSATGEDGVTSSFAGQFDSYLGICGAERVLAGVQRCWGSLFTARALTYRARHDIDQLGCPMAVGVLELVPARASGVAFSLDPVTGKRDRIVLEGSWGWGEAVVQGLVTPDHVEVGKADLRVLSYRVAHKTVVSSFDYALGGVVETEMPLGLQDEPVLDTEEIAAVVDAVLAAERCAGHPVDVEWVIDRRRRRGEQATLVQVRPETVHSSQPAAEAAPTWNPAAYAARYAFGGRH